MIGTQGSLRTERAFVPGTGETSVEVIDVSGDGTNNAGRDVQLPVERRAAGGEVLPDRLVALARSRHTRVVLVGQGRAGTIGAGAHLAWILILRHSW